MKHLRSGPRAFLALILVALAGCDNVDWGGVDVAVVPPPPRGGGGAEAEEETELGPMPSGPVLYHVRTDSAGATIVPVAEIGGDSLISLGQGADPELYGARFISEHMRRGAEFTLFRRGARAGTLLLRSAEIPTSGACRRLPRGHGRLEIGENDTISAGFEFLALAKASAPEGRSVSVPLQATGGMRRVAPILAERALRARGSQLPGNWNAAMVQLQPFPVSSSGDAGHASTFLVDDQLQVGNDDTGYSLFMVAVPRSDLTGYDTVYVHQSVYEQTGKRAPRVVDFLDWDRDGGAELLLEVYGTSRAWFEAVGPAGESDWGRAFAETCDTDGGPGGPSNPAADSLMRDTISSGNP